MNQKEKAIELVDKYLDLEFQVGRGEFDGYITIELFEAKECALIVVDEFISYFSEEGFKMAYPEIAIREIEYWNGVKQEIEKL
jgi:hypothetical protein